MATWKKIIVSGSIAELATVSASIGMIVSSNQQIRSTSADTRLSGSFSGSFSGDGTNLTGVTATATFPTVEITDLASASKFFTSDGTNKFTTYGSLLTDLAGTNLAVESTDSLTLASTITGLTSVSATSFSGSFSGSFEGNGSNLTGIALGISGSTGNGTVNLTTQALSVVGTANEVETSVSGQTITVGLPDNVTFAGDIAVNGGDITTSAATFSIANATATTINVGTTGATTVSIGNSSSTTTVNNKLVVTGDLVVNGTTTTVDTTNLTIEDKFALFASGSDGSTDGGIIVQQGATNGYALGVDASADRWALQNNLGPTATAIEPDAFMGVIQQWADVNAKPVSPQYGGASGYGTIGVQIDTGDVWIYS